jgi:hypothetical protein
MIKKDIRMRNIDEMMAGIKSIKYNSYEPLFYQKVLNFLL